MTKRHIHDMKPTIKNGRIYQCTSCLFRCSANALAKVKANTSSHRLIKANDPQARQVWTG